MNKDFFYTIQDCSRGWSLGASYLITEANESKSPKTVTSLIHLDQQFERFKTKIKYIFLSKANTRVYGRPKYVECS